MESIILVWYIKIQLLNFIIFFFCRIYDNIIISAKLFRLATAEGAGSGKLSDLNEVRFNNYGSLPNITFICDYDRQDKLSSWHWRYDNRKYSVLPQCSVGCKEQPPPENVNVTRIWKNYNYWDHTLGRRNLLDRDIPTYKCKEGNNGYFDILKQVFFCIKGRKNVK